MCVCVCVYLSDLVQGWGAVGSTEWDKWGVVGLRNGFLEILGIGVVGRSGLGIARFGLAWSELGTVQDGGDNDEDWFEQDGFEQENKGMKEEEHSTHHRVEGTRTTF